MYEFESCIKTHRPSRQVTRCLRGTLVSYFAVGARDEGSNDLLKIFSRVCSLTVLTAYSGK